MSELGLYGSWLTVNRFCNFRCRWCYAQETKFRKEDNMSLELASTLVDLIADIGIKGVILIGGEPTFWPHLFTIADRIRERDMHSVLVTNGYLLGHPTYFGKFVESSIGEVNISLKASNPDQHVDFTRARPDTFDSVLAGIRNVSQLEGIRSSVSVVVSSLNLPCIDDFVRVAAENGAKEVNLQLCSATFENETPVRGYMADAEETVRVLMDKFPVMVDYMGGEFLVEQTLPKCVWPQEFVEDAMKKGQMSFGCHVLAREGLIFDLHGYVLPCNDLHIVKLGQYGADFVDKETFSTFWHSPEINAFYDDLVSYPVETCMDCEDYLYCGGGCPLQWFIRDPRVIIPERRNAR